MKIVLKIVILLAASISQAYAMTSEAEKKSYDMPEIMSSILPSVSYVNSLSGKGTIDEAGDYSCTLIVSPRNSVVLSHRSNKTLDLFLVVDGKEVGEINLKKGMKDFVHEKVADLAITYDASHPETLGIFTSTGYMTNQYEGYSEYVWNFTKTSTTTITVSYDYHWADDDGGSGYKSYACSFDVK